MRRLGGSVNRGLRNRDGGRWQLGQSAREHERACKRVLRHFGEQPEGERVASGDPVAEQDQLFGAGGPRSRVARTVPPELGRIPMLTSGKPSTAESSATRKSAASASSRPPPRQ